MNLFKEVSVQGDAITARSNQCSIVFKGVLYVLMGYNGSLLGDMYWTRDGRYWEKRDSLIDTDGNTIAARSLFGLCEHNNRVYLMGGYNQRNEVYVTSDMVNWKKLQNAPWSGRYCFGCFSFMGKLWVMGGKDSGYKNDVWWTTDGTDWTQEANAPWSARSFIRGVVFNNKIYIVGGFNGTTLSDVWRTSDCRNWKSLSAIGGTYQARNEFSLVIDGQRIALIGGANGATYYNDIWHTPDGFNWNNNTPGPGNIKCHSTVCFNNRILTICGANASGYLSDIWESKKEALGIK